ncbi:MAG: hypothetical protein ACR2RE_02030 [Geminicoccaceae bacterium]
MREVLERIGRSCSAPDSLVRRVQTILVSANGGPTVSLTARFGVSHPTVSHRRKKRGEQGLLGLDGAEC